MALTAPVLVPVVVAPPTGRRRQRRSGPPCPPCCRAPGRRAAGNSGLPPTRAPIATTAPTTKTTAIAAKIAQPWRWSAAIARTCSCQRERDRRGSASISSKLVSGVGFSNGWAELALKKPPPLVPSSLIASWEAIGPREIVCWRPASVVHVGGPVARLGHALPDEDERADEGDRQQDVERRRASGRPRSCRSSSTLRRTMPRISAIAMAMPTAADTKFWTARPSAWVRWAIVVSPE